MSRNQKTADYILSHPEESAAQIAQSCGVEISYVRSLGTTLGINFPPQSGYVIRALRAVFQSDPGPIIAAAVFCLNLQQAARAFTRLCGFCISPDALRYHVSKIAGFPAHFQPSPEARAVLEKALAADARCHEFIALLIETTE